MKLKSKKYYLDALIDWFLCGGFVLGVLQIPVLFWAHDADYYWLIKTESQPERQAMWQRLIDIDIQQQRAIQGPQIAVALVLFIIAVVYHRKELWRLIRGA